MRRPPDKDGQQALSERDVESSNATLNAFFGGSRQKSWMQGVGAPVRPTPRAVIPKAPAAPAVLAQKTMAAVLPSPAPSDEPSPVLANSPMNGLRNENYRDIQIEESRRPLTTTTTNNVRIRQTPSAEADVGTPREPHPTEALFQPPSSSSRSPIQPRRQSTNINQASDPPTTSSTFENPPLPSSVFLPSEREEMSEEAPSPIQETVGSPAQGQSPVPDQHGVPSPQISTLSGFGITSRSAHAQQSVAQNYNGPQQVNREVGEFSHSRVNSASIPRAAEFQPLAIQGEAQSYPSPTTSTTSNPHKRQRVQVPVMPTLKTRLALIDSHIEASGGVMNLNTGLERPRFQLLKEACNEQDSFYVALHQVFCVWDVHRQEVLNITGFPNSNILTSAFRILGQLIRDNDQLAPNHKIWFSTFPSPLGTLLSTSEPYRITVADIGVFLERLVSDWGPLSYECTNRGYPPLVDELVNRMGLLSPKLQGVVFTATRRNLGIRDEEVGTRMEDLFRRDQKEHQALAARFNTSRPPTAKELQERNAALVNEYLTLHNNLLQRRSSAAMAGNPLMRGPTPVLHSNAPAGNGRLNNAAMPRPQQGTHSTTTWHPNMPSPDPNGSWQFGNQQQPVRVTNSSPNPSIIAGRPPSVESQRVYQNTPSPTLLQGLSMQSPVQQGFQFPTTTRNLAQAHPNQNVPPSYPVANFNRNLHQPPVDSIVQQRNQIALQQHQLAAQQQFSQLQHHAPQGQWHQNSLQSPQHQVAMRQQQQNTELEQQALTLHRATQLRQDSNGASDPQRARVRNNSMGSNGRRTPTANSVSRPASRIGGPPTTAHGRHINNEQTSPDVHTYTQKHPLHRAFLPPSGYSHPPQQPIPDIVALHQAYLRSPRLVAADPPPPDMAPDDPALRYYQAIRGFALPPTRVSMNTPLSKFDFRIPESELAMIPKDIHQSNGQLTNREFRRGTLQYRLRCIQTKKTDTKCPITEWVLQDTVWPEGASFSINKKHLELRRKNHHGKDLPIDVTPFVRLPGHNSTSQVSLSILRGRTKMKEFSYFIAVEVVEILQHGQILEMCRKNRIHATVALDKIKRSLAGPANEDDDIAMVISDLSIDLADPFTARIYETPVRGSSCLHRECFDLETFLLTRNSRPKRPGQPCMVDVWKCPLCGKDARPYSLQIDDFLVSIRQALEGQGNLDVKAIWIGADGTWRPKVEKRKAPPDPNDSDDSDDEGQRRSGIMANPANQSNQSKLNRVVEVIDLDDD